MPRTVRLRVIDEPAAGTRVVIDLRGEAFLQGQMSTKKSPGLLQQLCGQCERVILTGRPDFSHDGAGNPIVLRCAHCGTFNEMTGE